MKILKNILTELKKSKWPKGKELLVLSIYLLTNYLLFEPSKDMYMTPSQPGMALAITIVTIPLWIYFLTRTTKINGK